MKARLVYGFVAAWAVIGTFGCAAKSADDVGTVTAPQGATTSKAGDTAQPPKMHSTDAPSVQ